MTSGSLSISSSITGVSLLISIMGNLGRCLKGGAGKPVADAKKGMKQRDSKTNNILHRGPPWKASRGLDFVFSISSIFLSAYFRFGFPAVGKSSASC